MASITPYQISVPDTQIADLKQRLSLSRFPNELEDSGRAMGPPLAEIKRLAHAWQHTYDWRRTEAKLNASLPQFTTAIAVPNFSPLQLHFVHARSPRAAAIPLLFVHGWPGSFYEAHKLLPLLTQDADPGLPSFHVVVPSLPNFGFSEGVVKRGFGLKQYAQAMHALMGALGYAEYVTQGGDWGSMITRTMATLYPEAVRTAHINMPACGMPRPWRNPLVFLHGMLGLVFGKDRTDLEYSQRYENEMSGYLKQQDTRPQTLGYALADSPVGLLAWVYEKLYEWTDEYPWTDDEILTWISIYAFSTAGPAASVRIYYESVHPAPGGISREESLLGPVQTDVPLALAYFPKEIIRLPKSWGYTIGNVVQLSEFERGGHFAAFEVPELLVSDLRKLFGKKGASFEVVKGSRGF
ncbi:MAG: hypothetical protein LQ340_001332 [Diploschistes diacapsis]|nr:MAG: hypothetical protein LQ340_001332 [Diploschistes diacapsis]